MALTKKEYFVKDLVIDDEYGIIDSNATIQEAAKKMKEIGVPDLVVVEGEAKKVLGVIADFDIVKNDVAEGKDTKTEKVLSTMYKISPVTLDTPVTEAFNRMRDLNVNVIPVIKDEKLVGVCTIQDCWSFIPDQTVDDVGLIPVKNTKAAEFWFASVCVILGFTLGILLPLAGIFGFFTANQSGIQSLLGIAPVIGDPIVTFNLFDATGLGIMVPFLNLFIRNGPIWLVIDIFSILLLIFGIVGLFSIVYVSFFDTRNLQTGWIIRMIIPGLTVFFMAFEWILFGIAFALETPQPAIVIDPVGLTMSIVSMVLFLLAINRDYIFRGKEETNVLTGEVKL
ncbi:MAG: CBS domain-containing protein [Candidatus Lokiarchaeota archaeon]|nr:CBS domain-containing protein [Candidatus Lokiarchaeota archaeon]